MNNISKICRCDSFTRLEGDGCAVCNKNYAKHHRLKLRHSWDSMTFEIRIPVEWLKPIREDNEFGVKIDRTTAMKLHGDLNEFLGLAKHE